MRNDVIVPAQIRAGRALLEWSQERLAKEAEVGLSTIRDTESEKRAGDTGAVASIRRALWNGGVVFVPGNSEGGPGVRLVGKWPNIIRRPTTMQSFEGMPFTVEWEGKAITVFVSREVLDDLGEFSGHVTEEVYLQTFERHRGKILDAITLAILDPENFDQYGRLYIRTKDMIALDDSQWWRVNIDKGEDIRDMEATALMNAFAKIFISAGIPPNANVFHGRTPTGGHIYFFSPRAAEIAKDLLGTHGAIACQSAPDLADLRKVKL